MNKHTLLLLVAITLSAIFSNSAKATHAAGGEISYEWVSDSTYRVYFKFYRDCSGAGAPGNNSVILCITNSCSFYSSTVYMNRITKLPDSTLNGSPVSTGCAGVGTKCSSSTSIMPGYQEWWYAANVTLPARCNAWKFSVQLAARNPSVNLVNAGSTSLYVEATLNNVAAQGNSSPYFSVKPVPSVCINQNYTYNNGGVDPNSDSLTFEMSRPQNTAGGCPMTTTNITFAAASPAFNTSTNPLQTNNSFVLDTTTGQMTFKPTQLGAATLTTVIKEYRNGVLIGTVMRDIQVYVINCSVPGPVVNTVSSTISGATLISGKIQACAGVAMSFCFDMVSTDTAAKLKATDNHNASAPNSSVTYTGQGTDSIRGCFSWTPGTLDTGLRVFTVTVKDSTCKSPGALISQTFVLPIYIWPITDIVKDTTLCYGDTVKLIAVGGSVFTWSALAGGSGITSLSCTTCKEPFAWPTTNTQYRVTNSATQYCSKNSDTVTVNVLDIRYDTLQASSNSAVCEGDSLKLFATNAPTGYGYRWTGPGGFSSTTQNPVVPNVASSGGGNYILKSTKLHCTSRPDTTVVTIKPRPSKPTATNNGALCAGSTLNLYATNVANATYIWSGPASFSSTLQNPSVTNADTSKAGKYIVRASSTVNGCLSLPDTTTAVINHIPVISSVNSSQPTTCNGTQGTITLNGLKPSTSYIVNYTKNNIPQSPASLSANSSGILVISGLAAGTYSQIRVTLSGCTSAMAADVILTDPLAPVLAASGNSPLCEGDTILLFATTDSSGVTYSWTGPLSFSSSVQNPVITAATVAHTGSYIVTATKNNCTSTADTVSVNVFSIPTTPTAGSNSPVCAGDTLALTATTVPGAGYNWSGPASFSNNLQNPYRFPADTSMSGVYSVSVTVNGCTSAADTETILVKQLPASPVVSNNTPVCEGDTILLFASTVSGANYIWTGPNSFSSSDQNPIILNATVDEGGTYYVSTTINGCSSVPVSTNAVVNPTPATPTASNNGPLCTGNTLQLSAGNISNATYSWTGPSGFSSAQQNPAVTNAQSSMSGAYIVIATVNSCISLPDTTTVSINTTPAPVIGGSSIIHPTTCGGSDGSITLTGLTVSTSFTVNFNINTTPQSPLSLSSDTSGKIVIANLSAGTYSNLTITAASGCVSVPLNTLVLSDPTPPSIALYTFINPTTCTGTDGYIQIGGMPANTSYIVNFKRNNTSQTPRNLSSNTSGEIIITGLDAGTYGNITVTAANNCVSNIIDSVVLEDPDAPVVNISNNSPLCENDTLKLFATADSTGVSWNWTGPLSYSSAAQNPVIPNSLPAQSGVYVLTATKNNCTSLPDSTQVIVHPTPATPDAESNSPLCSGESLVLIATEVTGASYNWTGPQSFSDNRQYTGIDTVDTTNSGYYIVTATLNNCVSIPDTAIVIVYEVPVIDTYAYTHPTTCSGTEGTISLFGLKNNTGYTVNFRHNAIAQAPQNISTNGAGKLTISGLSAGTYTGITITQNNCTSDSVGAIILIDPNAPVVNTSNNSPICEEDTLKLFATADSAGVTWSWSGPLSYSSTSQNPVITNALPAQSGTYILTATKNNCTSIADTTIVVVHPTPATPVAASNSPLCTGDSLALTASNVIGADYQWTGPISFSANTQNTGVGNVDTPNSGNYIVTATVNNCVSLPDTAIVIVYDVPIIDTYAYTHPTTCGGTEGTVSLYGLKNNTNYTINFRHNAIAQAPQNISTNGTGILTISGLSAGTYTGIAITQNNCTSDSVATIILIDPNAPVVNTSNNSPICEGDTLKLFATADSTGVTWSWSGPLSYSSTSQNPVITNALPAQSGTYILTATKNNCTSIADTTVVIVHPTPATPVAASNSPLCTGDSLTLTASNVAGADYQWTGPISFSANTQNTGVGNVDTPNTGNYIVTATINNCVSLPDTAMVIVYDVPIIDTYAFTHPTTCSGTEGTISLFGLKNNTGYTINFRHNAIAQAPQNISTNGTGILTISGLSAGTYTGIAITQNNCTSDSVGAIILIDPNAPVVNTSNNSPICEEDTLKLFATADSAGVTWSWSGPLSYNSTSQNPVITNALPAQSGTYILTASKNNCTSIADTTVVIVHPTPATPVAASNSPLCTGDSLTLTASNVTGADYQWTGPISFSANTQNTGVGNVDTPNTGNYIVTATVNNCISLPDTAMVIVYDVPIIDTYAYTHPTTCSGTEGTISLFGLKNNTGYTVNFRHNAIAQTPQNISTNGAGKLTISGLGAGTYTGIAITQNNCTSDSVGAVILIDPNAPVVNTSNNSPICEEDTLKLFATADSAGVTWSWSGPLSYSSTSQNPVITNALPTQSGTYILTATKNNCTSIADTTIVIVHPTPLLPTASNNGPLCSGNTLNLFADTLTGATYAWSGPMSFTSSAQNPSITNAQPAISGKYYVYATVNGCISPTDSTTVAVYPLPAPIIGATTLYHPTTCGGSDGKILISGLNANATYIVNYLKNGAAQSPASIAANGSGTLTIPNLTAGNYTNTTVTSSNGCTSDPLPLMVLADPVPPVITVSAFTHPTTCLGSNGTITLSGLQQNSVYKLMYRKDSVAQSPVSLTGASSGTIVLTGLTKGYYDSLNVEIYNCYSNITGPVVLNDPNAPVVTASAVSPICEGATIMLTGTSDSAGVVWAWSGPMSFTSSAQNPSIPGAVPAQSGTYTLYATKNNCTSATDTATVLVHPTPATPLASNNTPICSGSTLQLTSSTVAGATYEWTGPKSFTASLQSPAIAGTDSSYSGNYIVRAIVNNCYSLPDTTTAVVHQVPEIDSAEYMHPITCNGTEGSIILTGLLGNTAYTVQYNKNSVAQPSQLIATNTSGRLAITGLSAGLYTAITVTLNNCTSDTATAIQLVDPNLPVVATNNNTPICEGDTLRLFASADSSGVTWSWTGPLSFSSTAQNPVITNALPTQSGMYILTATKNNCTSVADTTTIVVHPTPATPLASNNSPLCAGSTLQLISTTITGATYYWTGPQTFSSSAQSPAITNADTFHSGDYIVYVTVNNCPSPKDTTTVVVHHIPAIDTFEYTNPATCGGTQGTITLKGLRSSLLYTVDFNRNGIAQAPQNINTNSTGNLVITGLNAGVYSGIRVTLNNCTSDSISPVILNDPNAPGAYASNNTAICQGDTLLLTAGADSTGVNWQWSGPMSYNSTVQNPSVQNALPGMSGTYTLTVTKNNCISIDTTTVLVHPTPATPVASSNSPLCSGDTLLLIAPTVAGATWSWSGPNSFTSSSQNPSINSIDTTYKGNYIVTVSVNGCLSLPDTETVSIYHLPAITNTSYGHPITCGGTQGYISLSGLVPNATFSVTYKKNGTPQTPVSFSSNSSGILTITGLNAGVYDSIRVAVQHCASNIAGPFTLQDPNAPAAFPSNNTDICQGDTLILYARSDSSGVTWSWTGPLSFTSTQQTHVLLNAQPAQSGTYFLTATKNNCSSAPTPTSVVVHPTPPVPVVNSNSPLCPGDVLNLSAPNIAGATYQWTGPLSFSDTGRSPSLPNVQPVNSGSYSVTMTVNGCISPAGSANVVVNTTPPAPVAPPWVYYCQDDTAQSLTAIGANLLWYTTATGGTGTPFAPVPATNTPGVSTWYVSQVVNGCEGPRTRTDVLVRPLPAPPVATPALVYCQDAPTAPLTATGTSLLWYTVPVGGSGTVNAPTPSSSTPGTFKWYVSQTDANGCESKRDSTGVTINPVFRADIQADNDTVCVNDNIIVYNNNTTIPASTITWNFGGADVISGDSSGPYVLSYNTPGVKNIKLAVNNTECDEDDSLNVYVAPLPDGSFSITKDGCVNGAIELNPLWKDGAAYQWSLDGGSITDSTNRIYQATWAEPGNKIIVLIVYSGLGCSSGPYTAYTTIHDKPVVSISYVSNYDVCAEDTIALRTTDSTGLQYQWMAGSRLLQSEGPQALAVVTGTDKIILTGTDEWGCRNTDSADVTAHTCCEIAVPNAFSPNNDGLNDRFRIITNGNQRIGTFIILNRWGQKLFETNDVINGWDGTHNGKPQVMGTYYYYIKYTCTSSEVFEKKGEVILLR